MSAKQINQLILGLYRASHEVPYRRFQEHALGLTKTAIPYDSAWWGLAAANPEQILQLHLHNCDQSLVDDYPPYMAQDFFRASLIANPGVTINMSDLTSREAFVQTEFYQAVGRRYKIEWSLGTLLIEPVSSLFEFITLWRHDGDKPFSEDERRLKERLMPHLAEAHRNARLHHMLGGGMAQGTAWALADERGYLREVSQAFITRIRREWPAWQGSRLPDLMAECVIRCVSFTGHDLVVEVTRREGFRFLEARTLSALERLAPREKEVTERYARGMTHGEIAMELSLSPATVRNHIARCFKKLGVNNKTELVNLVNKRKHQGIAEY